MNIVHQFKAGFSFAGRSVAFLYHHPRVLLYWVLPIIAACTFIVSISINVLFFSAEHYISNTLHVHPKIAFMILVSIPLTLIAAAFIIHCNNILNHKKTTLSDSLWHLLAILPWLILWPFVEELPKFGALIATSMLQLPAIVAVVFSALWSICCFYGLVVIVVDRVNTFKAVWVSIKAILSTWLEALISTICVFIPYIAFGFLLTVVTQAKPSFTATVLSAALFMFLTAIVLIVLTTLKLLLYKSYKR